MKTNVLSNRVNQAVAKIAVLCCLALTALAQERSHIGPEGKPFLTKQRSEMIGSKTSTKGWAATLFTCSDRAVKSRP